MTTKLEQKIGNFLLAVESLRSALALPVQNDRDVAGIIQNFEFTYETGWKALKEWLAQKGVEALFPRDVFEKAYAGGALESPDSWAEMIQAMIQDRNLSSHTYDRSTAQVLVDKIRKVYFPLFQALAEKLDV